MADPVFPIVDPHVTTDLAAGDAITIDSLIIAAGKTGKIQQITLSSSAACKWEIQKLTGGVPTVLDVIFTSGFTGNSPTHEWEPPHKNYAELPGNGVDTFFRVIPTNLDARNAAPAYVTYYLDEV